MNTDEKNRILLHEAARIGHTKVCKFLVEECGADVFAIDGDGVTAFYRAIENNQRETCEYFGRRIQRVERLSFRQMGKLRLHSEMKGGRGA